MQRFARRSNGWLVASTVGVFALGAGLAGLAAGRSPLAEASGPPAPVLVELFTSEGCSSCPSAEVELSRLTAEQPIPGARVVPLAFHVDYWDHLGWADPFSSSAWTARQGQYARGRGGQTYTPEAVVQGGRDCVGSDDRALQGLVSAAAQSTHVDVDVIRADLAPPDTLHVTVRVGSLPGTGPRVVWGLQVAVAESGLSVAVPRGENGGRTLAHAPLARDLTAVGAVGASGGTFDAVLRFPAGSRRENLDVVAFVQADGGGRVLGVGTRKPAPE